jgi:hypothetical protein
MFCPLPASGLLERMFIAAPRREAPAARRDRRAAPPASRSGADPDVGRCSAGWITASLQGDAGDCSAVVSATSLVMATFAFSLVRSSSLVSLTCSKMCLYAVLNTFQSIRNRL